MTLQYWLLLTAVLALAVLAILYPRIRRYMQERKLARELLGLGLDCRHSTILRDVLDEGIYLDYLVLLPDRIVLLDVKRYRGNIFAAWNMDMWTQVLGRQSFKFPNPLYKLDADVSALKAIVPEIPVEGYIVFAGDNHFARGVPVGVMLLEDVLIKFRCDRTLTAENALQLAWQHITGKLAEDQPR